MFCGMFPIEQEHRCQLPDESIRKPSFCSTKLHNCRSNIERVQNKLILISITSVILLLRNFSTYQTMSYNLSIENTLKAVYILSKMNFTLSVTDYK